MRSQRGPIQCETEDDVRVARVAGYRDDEIEFQGRRFVAQPEQQESQTNMTQQKSTQQKPEALEAQARRDWDRDAALRTEFDNDFATFAAYARANAAGLVRVLGRT